MKITRGLVEYLRSTKFEQLPEDVVRKTKNFILDEFGNALGGAQLKSGSIITEWGKQLGGAPESTIFADGTKVSMSIASGINTQLCMGLELMETYKNRCHPGSGMVMTAFAIGQALKLTGKELITAICTAYDVTGRIIDATWPSRQHIQKVWNQPWQGCGPLIVAIKLFGLNEEQAMNAFGMGLGNGPTMNVHNILFIPGSMSKCANHFHNFVAVNAAALAKKGYTGYFEILDEPFAFWKTISDVENKDTYLKDLGSDFYVNSALQIKPWPTCRWAQPGIQSLLEIKAAENLTLEDIQEIVFHAHEKVTNYPYDSTDPHTPEDAYWSVPWAISAAAFDLPPGPSWYKDALFVDDKFKTFMKKIRIKTLPEAVVAFEKEPSKSITLLEIKTRAGHTFSKKTQYCKGDPQMPLHDDDIISKFLSQALHAISPEKAKSLIAAIQNFENLNDVTVLEELIS
jgi:2-methylcitrate dehydratase PrpD